MAMKTKKNAPVAKKAPVAQKAPHSDVKIPDAAGALKAISALERAYNPKGYHWICFCGDPSCGVGPFTKRVKGSANLSARVKAANQKRSEDCGCGNWGPMHSDGAPLSRAEFLARGGDPSHWPSD